MTEKAHIRWTADSILKFLEDHRTTLRDMGVTRIGVFGSYVRGEQREGSDVDFLLSLDHWTWAKWMDVWNFLEDELGLKVDLIPEKDLREEIRDQVLSEVQYAKE